MRLLPFRKDHLELHRGGTFGRAVGVPHIAPFDDQFAVRRGPQHVPEDVLVRARQSGQRSSQNGATSVEVREVGIGLVKGLEKLSTKLIVPLLLTYKFVKLPPPKRMGNGGVTVAATCRSPSSPRLRLVPVMLR